MLFSIRCGGRRLLSGGAPPLGDLRQEGQFPLWKEEEKTGLGGNNKREVGSPSQYLVYHIVSSSPMDRGEASLARRLSKKLKTTLAHLGGGD